MMSNRNLVPRGSYKPSPLSRTLFVALRALDPLLQYAILRQWLGIGWLPFLLGGSLLPTTTNAISGGGPSPTSPSSEPPNSTLILHLPPYQSLLLCMSIASMLKQTYWALFIVREEMSPSYAVIMATAATVMNSLNSVLGLWSRTSGSSSPPDSALLSLIANPTIFLGTVLFATGILLEFISEVQRSAFKADPKNEGQPYAGGLFGYARNINYTGFSLWKAGYAMVAAGLGLGIVVAVVILNDFRRRAVPEIEGYCKRRYGRDWEEVKRKVRWVLIPGVV